MPRWDDAARARQGELIHGWQPWTRSTGARTAAGKRRSAQNARLRPGSNRFIVRSALQQAKATLRILKLSDRMMRSTLPPKWKRELRQALQQIKNS